MKTHRSDRRWILLLLLLLLAEVAWLLIDLKIIDSPFFSKYRTNPGTKEAGHVLNIKNELKKRGTDSLIWDTIKENDLLYYNDSILTLSQSSAKVYLKDQTDLELSENTLVTLEEPSADSKSEIRLRFSKGDIRARNPNVKSSIHGDDWVVNLEKGSDVALRKEKDSYEFEVFAGQGTMQTASGKIEKLSQSSLLKLNANQQIQKIEKNQNLQWFEKKPSRIYTFDEQATVVLNWKGSANKLIISKVGEEEVTQNLDAKDSSISIDFKLGNYKIRLGDNNGLSTTHTVEIIKAPRIYLKKPLPRDRLKTGEPYEFIWTNEKIVKQYQIKIGQHVETSDQNYKSIHFKNEEDTQWQVEGRDEEGYLIPSFYESKIYIRDKTLQAPKLKAPSLRAPKKIQNNSSIQFKWWNLFVAESYALDINQELLFEWEPVNDADLYIIEISADPDFRNPIVMESVKSTRYIWKKYDASKRFFWRVAAGRSDGRMGVFSEPSELKPTAEELKDEAESQPVELVKEKPLQKKLEVKIDTQPVEKSVEKPVDVLVKEEPKKTIENVSAPAATSAPVLEKTPEKSEEQEAGFQLPSLAIDWTIAYAPSYKIVKIKGSENSQIQLNGGVPLGLEFGLKKNEYITMLMINSQTWKPKKELETSIQEDLRINDVWFYFAKGNIGLTLHQSFVPSRKTNETIDFQTQMPFGVRYSFGDFGLSGLTTGSVHEINFDFRYKKYFGENSLSDKKTIKYFYGVGGNGLYQMNKFGGGYQSTLNFLFGLDSF